MSRPDKLPSWVDDDDSAKLTEPSGTKKLQGWIYKERPAFQFWNWVQRNFVKWILHLDVSVNHFDPHEASTPDMTVVLSAGRIQHQGNIASVAEQTTTAFTAPTTNPRIDRIVIDIITGVYSVITGTEAASPVVPDLTIGKIAIAQVLLQTSSTSITGSMITDERAFSVDTPSYKITTLSAAAPRIEVTGLDFDSGEVIEADLYMLAKNASNLFFELNSDSTSANYYTATDVDASTALKGNVNQTGIVFDASDVYYLNIKIMQDTVNNEAIVIMKGSQWDSSVGAMITIQSAVKYTVTEAITAIGFYAGAASNIEIGTELKVKLNN